MRRRLLACLRLCRLRRARVTDLRHQAELVRPVVPVPADLDPEHPAASADRALPADLDPAHRVPSADLVVPADPVARAAPPVAERQPTHQRT
jgi:hypothetical protein